MRSSMLLAALIAISPVTVAAQDNSAPVSLPRQGQTLRDANSARLGTIDRVLPDGSVQIIFNSRFATIPASTISVVDGAVKTSLTRKEVAKLR